MTCYRATHFLLLAGVTDAPPNGVMHYEVPVYPIFSLKGV